MQKHLISFSMLICALAAVATAFGQSGSRNEAKRAAPTEVNAEEDDSSCNCGGKPRRFTLEVDDAGKIKLDKNNLPKVVESAQKSVSPGVTVKARRNFPGELSIIADCTTRPTTNNRERKSCDSDWEEVTVPTGYVFSKDNVTYADEISYGSENNQYIDWADYVEVIPGIEAPRTMRFRVTARSGRDPGERGRTRRTATCPYVQLP